MQDRETLGIYLDNYSKQTKVHLKEFIEMARHFSDERCIVMGDMNDVAGSLFNRHNTERNKNNEKEWFVRP